MAVNNSAIEPPKLGNETHVPNTANQSLSHGPNSAFHAPGLNSPYQGLLQTVTQAQKQYQDMVSLQATITTSAPSGYKPPSRSQQARNAAEEREAAWQQTMQYMAYKCAFLEQQNIYLKHEVDRLRLMMQMGQVRHM